MASLQLYSENFGQGLQTFTLAEANLLEATAGTHYTENWRQKTTDPRTREEIWSIKLTIPLAGMDYITVNKSNQPLPEYPLIRHGDTDLSWYPSYIDPEAEALSEQPSDWEVHWRDKYNTLPAFQWGDQTKTCYYSSPNLPQNTTGAAPTFQSGTYYDTNVARHIYWTIDGNYFPFEWGWFRGTTAATTNNLYYGLQFSNARYQAAQSSWTNQYQNVNNPRFAGVSGQLVYANARDGANYLNFTKNYGAYTSLTSDIEPLIYFNFIGFKYKFIDTTGDDPTEKTEEFIGLIAWENSADNIPQNAQIMALSKKFFGMRKKPASGGPISSIQGGNGTFSAPSDNRGDRSGSTVQSIASLWANNISTFSPGYNNYLLGSPDVAAFRQMIQGLWNPDIIQGFRNLMMSPISAIVCCHQVPANLAQVSTSGNDYIRAAGITLTETQVPTFSQWITHWHGGSIDLSEYTGSFADYTDTSIYIHLPYIGTQLIDTAACMDGWLAVDYATDLISGECTAFITCCDKFGNTQIRYEFKGDCSRDVDLHQRVPTTTKVASAVAPALVSAGVGAVVGGVARSAFTAAAAASLNNTLTAMGNEGVFEDEDLQFLAANLPTQNSNAFAGAASSVATSATAALTSGQAMTSSNASGGNVSSPIDTQIWVLITRPQWSNPELYERQRAYPSDISGAIGDFSGFLSVSSAELNGIECTDAERSEILERLFAGVLLS